MIKHTMLLVFFLLQLLTASANSRAQTLREVPPDAFIARTNTQRVYPEISLNSKTYQLAPGGRIIDSNNRSLTHNQLISNAPVALRLDTNHQISLLWLLSESEYTQYKKSLNQLP
jgi:hypothetical protein